MLKNCFLYGYEIVEILYIVVVMVENVKYVEFLFLSKNVEMLKNVDIKI